MRLLPPFLVTSLGMLLSASALAPTSSAWRLEDDEPGDQPDASEPDSGAPEAGSPGPKPAFPSCIDVHAWAQYAAGGYDHIVRIENGCDKAAHCEIATDVSPEVIATTIPAGESRDTVTYRGSPSSEFQARVKCDLDD